MSHRLIFILWLFFLLPQQAKAIHFYNGTRGFMSGSGYLLAGNLSLKILASTTQESGSSVGAGGQLALKVLTNSALVSSAEVHQASSSYGGSNTLGFFEQLFVTKLGSGKSSVFALFGAEVIYLNTPYTGYGYNALLGIPVGFIFDSGAFNFLLKIAPVANSGTQRVSNMKQTVEMHYNFSPQVVGNERTTLFAHASTIDFYSLVMDVKTNLTYVGVGLYRGF